MASIAARVETGWPQLSGVATSSRTGTKRSVKAGPTMRSPRATSGFGPFIQQRRMPFFNSIVVIVAVVTLRRMSNNASLIAASCRSPVLQPIADARDGFLHVGARSRIA